MPTTELDRSSSDVLSRFHAKGRIQIVTTDSRVSALTPAHVPKTTCAADCDSGSLTVARLCELASLSDIKQAHFLGYYLSRAVLDLLTVGWTQFSNYFIHVHGRSYVPSRRTNQLKHPLGGNRLTMRIPQQLRARSQNVASCDVELAIRCASCVRRGA
jgi:hypothetical protein